MPPLNEENAPTLGEDLAMVTRWATLGAAAGGLGGMLVGGVGGRLAMFALRVTSDRSVRGVESDDGFTIGRFDVISTASLVFVTGFLGAIVGLIIVVGRPFFPRKGMPIAWGGAGAITGGAILIHTDGIDFNLLEPHWFAVACFVAIPALGVGLIAWLVEQYNRFWWERRTPTVVAGLAAVPALVFLPVAIAAAVVSTLWLLVLRFRGARRLSSWTPARMTAFAVFVGVAILGALDLVSDVRTLLL